MSDARFNDYGDDTHADELQNPDIGDNDQSWENYEGGAYRGGYNDDLQYMAHERQQRERRQAQAHHEQRGVQRRPGPFSDRGPRTYARSDARILDDVVMRLTMAGQLDARNMRINVQNAVVVLEGTVPTRQEKRLAEDIADSVPGVKDVENRLRLSGQTNL